jgi:putative PepSY-like beta-lactamase-inhibitor
MKKMLFIAAVLIAIHASAQKIGESKVPAPVKDAFSRYYPAVSKPKWEKENGYYEANFTQNGVKMSATFEEHGGWLETETRIEVNSLPSAATDYIAKNYKGEKIKEASKIKMANGDSNYEAEVKGTDLLFDDKGKFIKAAKD